MKSFASSFLKLFKKSADYLLIAVLVTLLFLPACAMRQVMPFGNRVLGSGDLMAQTLPFLYRMWDVVHGSSRLYFDWNVGLGTNFTGTLSHSSLFSPFALYLLLVSRKNVQKYLIFFILSKLICMGLAMNAFLKHDGLYRCHPLKDARFEALVRILFSVGYALNGYCLQYFGFGWIDPAVFFPLLLIFYDRMMLPEKCCPSDSMNTGNSGKLFNKDTLLYTLLLALILILSIQQSYAVCLYLIVYSGAVFLFLRPENAGIKALRLAVSSVLGLLLSAFFFLPAVVNIVYSYRAGELFSTDPFHWYLGMLTEEGLEYFRKQLMFESVWVAAALCILFLLFLLLQKKWSRLHSFYLFLLLSAAGPVLVESINVILADGYYASFPMRYGFLVAFLPIAAAFGLMHEVLRLRNPEKTVSASSSQNVPAWINPVKKPVPLPGYFYAGWLLCCLLWTGNILYQEHLLLATSPGEISVELSESVREQRRQEDATVFDRIKCMDASLFANYPMILGAPSLSAYNPVSASDQVFLDQMLGYSQIWVRLIDTGGTLFSDSLLGMNTILSRTDLPGEAWMTNHTGMPVYTLLREETIQTSDKETNTSRPIRIGLYRSSLQYPSVLFSSLQDFAQSSSAADGTLFGTQNILSQAFFGTSLIRTSDAEPSGSDTLRSYEIPIEGNGILYFYSEDAANLELSVNGETVGIPNYEYESNTIYPNYYNDRLISLGSYGNETVHVELRLREDLPAPYTGNTGYASFGEVHFGILDLDRFQETVREAEARNTKAVAKLSIRGCRIELNYTAEESGFVYLPVYTDEGWSCKINGTSALTGELAGALMMIPVEPGENRIVLSYRSPGTIPGVILSVLALLILLLITSPVSPLQTTKIPPEPFLSFVYGLVLAVCAAGILLIYLIPILREIVLLITG